MTVVNASDVEREVAPDVVLLTESSSLRILRNVRAGAEDDPLSQAAGRRGAALFRDAESPHMDAVDRVGAGFERIRPRRVVARARRQPLDVGVLGEMFGDVAGVKFGAAVNRQAVALNDN